MKPYHWKFIGRWLLILGGVFVTITILARLLGLEILCGQDSHLFAAIGLGAIMIGISLYSIR